MMWFEDAGSPVMNVHILCASECSANVHVHVRASTCLFRKLSHALFVQGVIWRTVPDRKQQFSMNMKAFHED